MAIWFIIEFPASFQFELWLSQLESQRSGERKINWKYGVATNRLFDRKIEWKNPVNKDLKQNWSAKSCKVREFDTGNQINPTALILPEMVVLS